MLKVYDNAYSSCSTKVRLVLNEKTIEWTREPIDLTLFDQKTPEYLKLNPNGVVPTVVPEDGEPLIESHVIIQFLDNRFPGIPLAPAEPAERARMQMFLKLLDDFHLSQGILNYDQLFLPYWRRLPESEFTRRLSRFADAAAADRLRWLVKNGLGEDRVRGARVATEKFFASLDERLSKRRWVMGGQYTLADIALTPYVNSALHAVTNFWFNRKEHISRWLTEIQQRPNFQPAVFAFMNPPDLEQAIADAPEGGGFRAL